MKPAFMATDLHDNGFGKTVGEDKTHLKLNIIEGVNQKTYNAIGFSLGNKLPLIQQGTTFKAVFCIDENHWNGNTSLQLVLKDIQKD
jgi:single-stranded-DNA-specific exonuclease